MYTKISIKTSEKPGTSSVGRTGRGARVAGLTEREAEVLRLLFANRNKRNTPHTRGETEPGWCRPLDLGGTQQSHHSNTLRRLARMGYVWKKPYSDAGSHASIYKVSVLGESVWEIYVEYQQQLKHQLLSQGLITPGKRLRTLADLG